MKVNFKSLLHLFLGAFLMLAQPIKAHNVLPQPQSLQTNNEQFVLNSNTVVATNLKGEARTRIADAVKELFPQVKKQGSAGKKRNVINIKVTGTERDVEQIASNKTFQSYQLNVNKDGVFIVSPTEAGAFYALQTLVGLQKAPNTLQGCKVVDEPRFNWRGYMIDCSRHYWTPAFIKKQIDMMAHFKLNRLHLHMVDGAGWRIQVDSYPQLTQKTAYRTSSDWNKWWIGGERTFCESNAPGAYGGFYTKQELRDIVAYAAKKHIVVLPEIEMPGHSEEVTYAYPELGCTGKPYTCADLCVGNEATFTFLTKVLDEILEIFPSHYIHIGGDEAVQEQWKTCPKCQKRMKDEGLKTTHELQSYMISRMGKYLNSKGRAFIGWDEIMEGGLAANASVMSWRGYEAGLRAAKSGHHVVMTPVNYCYLDYYQDNPTTEPQAMGGYVPLNKVYEYDPVPDSIKGTKTEEFIDGIQGNLWTEFVSEPSHLEYMTYPRLLAIAETGWTRNKPSFDNFKNRVIASTHYMKSKNFNPYNVEQADKPRIESVEPIQHEAIGKKVIYVTKPASKYNGVGESTLVDGKRGTWSYTDGCWQGFSSEGRMEVIIDMGKETVIRNISAEFMQFLEPWVHMPSNITIYTSNDNVNYQLLSDEAIAPSNEKYFIKNYEWTGNAKARYIKYVAKVAKQDCWVFTDEIVINKK